jgi:phage regulator Rha-like protein
MTNTSKGSILPQEKIMDKIYFIRGQKVMLDTDLANLYGVKPRRLREQVKRNLSRFPQHFMFQLNDEEVEFMVSQFATPSRKHLGGSIPYVFTEHGVLMLANVIKSDRAIEMSIKIIDIFVKMREMLLTHKDILLKLEQMEKQITENSGDISHIFSVLKKLVQQSNEPRKKIGYKLP